MNLANTLTNDMRGAAAERDYWLREIAICGAVAVLLALDIGALGCEQGFAALEQVAVHLWGPSG